MSTAAGPLAGKGIVITRPAHQAAHMAELLDAAGGKCILFPTIEIVAVEDQSRLDAIVQRLDGFDLAVFVSPNAVARAMNVISAKRRLPAHLKLATIGRGGVREFERHGVRGVIAPQRFDSEALLDLPELNEVAGKRVVIFRGEGGRALVADTLTARGALVEHAECYRRRRPEADATPVLDAWASGGVHAVSATSSEGLRNLLELIGAPGRDYMAATPLFVPHPRIERTARSLGLSRVVLTGQGDEQMTQGIIRWFSGG